MMFVAGRWGGLSALIVFSAFDLGRCPRLGWSRTVGALASGAGGGQFGDEGGEEVRGGGAGGGEHVGGVAVAEGVGGESASCT